MMERWGVLGLHVTIQSIFIGLCCARLGIVPGTLVFGGGIRCLCGG